MTAPVTIGQQGPASLAWERRMRGEHPQAPSRLRPLVERPGTYYRATILATMTKPDLTGRWLLSSEIFRRAISTLPKPARKGAHVHLRRALLDLVADPDQPVEYEALPRPGDARYKRRYRYLPPISAPR